MFKLATFTPDLSMLTDATATIGLIATAVVAAYTAKFALPVATSVFRFARRILSGS